MTIPANPISITREEEQDYLKYTKIRQYFNVTANKQKVLAWLPLKNEFALFEANMDAVAPIAQGLVVTSKGATTSKNNLKHIACQAVSIYTVVSRGFCLRTDINMSNEAANLNFSESSLFRIEDGSLLDTVTAINNVIATKLIPLTATFGPYGITAATLADGLQKATDFNNSLGSAGAIMAGRAATAIDVEDVFHKLHLNEVQFKHLMVNFKLSDANFYNGFVAADVEDDLIRHNNVAGLITSTQLVLDPATNTQKNALVANGWVKNKKSGLMVSANLLSEYDLHPNRTGLTEIEAGAPGFISQTKVFEIKRGKTIHWDWVLAPDTGHPIIN